MYFLKIPCPACANMTHQEKIEFPCRECNGLGYFVQIKPREGCTGKQPECPIFLDPMHGGLECTKCGFNPPS